MKTMLPLTTLIALSISAVAEAGPSSVREDWVASSAIVTVRAGRTWDYSTLPMPSCPSGQKFLVTHMSVMPRPATGQLGAFPEVKWAAFIGVRQHGNAPQGNDPILRFGVVGIGVQHRQIALPGGQPTPGVAYPNGQIAFNDASLQVDIETAMPTDLEFTVHVSGSCGTFHTQSWPVTASPRGTRQATRTP